MTLHLNGVHTKVLLHACAMSMSDAGLHQRFRLWLHQTCYTPSCKLGERRYSWCLAHYLKFTMYNLHSQQQVVSQPKMCEALGWDCSATHQRPIW